MINLKNRSQLREKIIKILYQVYILDAIDVSYNLDEIIGDNIDVANEFVTDSVKNIVKLQEEINTLGNKYLKNWTMERISKVDKAILSLGIYELLYTDTPNIICINEAIELSKMYSDEDVTKMINACLDKIYHNEVNEK